MNDYKLMPEEATPEMLAAGEHALEAGCYVSGIYADMRASAPDVQVDPVGYIRKSALELMKSAELGVRANIIKEPRYRDCVAIYTTPQTAEQQPDRDVRELAAALYQACGAYDMPTRVLDVLSAVANGLPFAHMIDGLLPCVPPSNQNVQGETVAWYTPATRYTPQVVALDDSSQRGEPLIRLSDHEELKAECEKLRKAIRRLCNIYVVDDYYSGDLREDHLNRAVERAIDKAIQEERNP